MAKQTANMGDWKNIIEIEGDDVLNSKMIVWDTKPVPELSEWRCYCFGGTNGFVWHPVKGKEPNWFWRWMQYICFGNHWVKEGKL